MVLRKIFRSLLKAAKIRSLDLLVLLVGALCCGDPTIEDHVEGGSDSLRDLALALFSNIFFGQAYPRTWPLVG